MLAVSQANALVYTTLVAFMGVGLFAGWRVKSKADFISGVRTQSGALDDAAATMEEALD